MQENGLLIGLALCFIGGLTCYLSSRILLLKSIEHETVEYIDIIKKCLGRIASKIIQVVISLGYLVCLLFGIIYFLDFFRNSMTCLGFDQVLVVMTVPLQYLVVFLILLPLYLHEKFSNMDFIFYGILVCFFTIVLFLLIRSFYLIIAKGVNPNIGDNLVSQDLLSKVKNFPIFTNILYTQDAVTPIFANAKEHTAEYKVGLLRRSIVKYTLVAMIFGAVCYLAGYGQNEDWMFQVEIETQFLRVFYYLMLCCLGICFLLYNGFVVQIFFQVNAPKLQLKIRRILSFGVLVLVLSFSYLVGDLKHFFALDALFNEVILGFIVPMYIYYITTNSKMMKVVTIFFMTINISVHIWAIYCRIISLK